MNKPHAFMPGDRHTLVLLRRFVLVIWLVGLLGTAAELVLLGHTEGFWQIIPLGLILASLLSLAAYGVARRRVCLRLFRSTLWLFVASGLAGMVLHLLGKLEFKRETDPSLAGWELFRVALQGSVPPLLAPAAMIQFGLLGLAYTFRHPVLTDSTTTPRIDS